MADMNVMEIYEASMTGRCFLFGFWIHTKTRRAHYFPQYVASACIAQHHTWLVGTPDEWGSTVGISGRTAEKGLRELEASGWLSVEIRYGENGRKSIYCSPGPGLYASLKKYREAATRVDNTDPDDEIHRKALLESLQMADLID